MAGAELSTEVLIEQTSVINIAAIVADLEKNTPIQQVTNSSVSVVNGLLLPIITSKISLGMVLGTIIIICGMMIWGLSTVEKFGAFAVILICYLARVYANISAHTAKRDLWVIRTLQIFAGIFSFGGAVSWVGIRLKGSLDLRKIVGQDFTDIPVIDFLEPSELGIWIGFTGAITCCIGLILVMIFGPVKPGE